MHQIYRIIQSYLVLRKVVLLRLETRAFSQFYSELPLTDAKLRIRRKKSETWTIDEIIALAQAFGINNQSAMAVRQLSLFIGLLNPDEQALFNRQLGLSAKKLRVRNENHNAWKLEDLMRIVNTGIA